MIFPFSLDPGGISGTINQQGNASSNDIGPGCSLSLPRLLSVSRRMRERERDNPTKLGRKKEQEKEREECRERRGNLAGNGPLNKPNGVD